MERWNAWWWAPDEWRAGPGMDDQDSVESKSGGGGGGGFAAYKAADPSSVGNAPTFDQGPSHVTSEREPSGTPGATMASRVRETLEER